jgi:hypothetical protein
MQQKISLSRSRKAACHLHEKPGWGGQSWTIFCRPAAVAVRRCERKDQRNPLGSSLRCSVNIAAGTSGPANAVEMACRRHTTQSFVRNENI